MLSGANASMPNHVLDMFSIRGIEILRCKDAKMQMSMNVQD